MKDDEWYYKVMGQPIGPISAGQLKLLAHGGDVRPDTPVRKGNGDWVTADHVRGLFEPTQPETLATPTAHSGSIPPDSSSLLDAVEAQTSYVETLIKQSAQAADNLLKEAQQQTQYLRNTSRDVRILVWWFVVLPIILFILYVFLHGGSL